MSTSPALRTVSVAVFILILVTAVFSMGSVATSNAEFAEKPDDLDAIHDGMAGTGTPDDPYEVSNLYELQAITVDLDAHYVLVDDIDARPTGRWDDGAGFEPIGSGDFEAFPMSEDEKDTLGFQGHFDGNGYEIHGLWINRDNPDIGLFGEIGPGGAVENLEIDDARIGQGPRIGVLAGLVVQGDIHNITITGSEVDGWYYQGGVVGVAYDDAHIDRVYFEGETAGEGLGIGGIAGWMSDGSELHQCGVEVEMAGKVGDPTFADPIAGPFLEGATGGVVGAIASSTISECGAHVDVHAPDRARIGGLIGESPPTDDEAGWYETEGFGGTVDPLVPAHSAGFTAEDSYVQGSIVGEDRVGGMVGRVQDGYAEDIYIAASVESAGDFAEWETQPYIGPIAGETLTTPAWGMSYYDDFLFDPYAEGGTETSVHNQTALQSGQMKGDVAQDHMDSLDYNTAWNTSPAPWPTYPHLAWEDRPDTNPSSLSWQFFNIGKMVGEHLSFFAGVGGVLVFAVSGSVSRQRRAKGLIIGSVVGLTTIALVSGLFEGLSWALAGRTAPEAGTAMLPPAVHGRTVYHQIYPTAAVLSQISVAIGSAGVAFGSGLWAISTKRSSLRKSSRRAIQVGVALMIFAVGGRLFSIATYIVLA